MLGYVRLCQVTSGYVSLRWRDGTWSSTICLGTGRDSNDEVTFHSDNIKTANVHVGSGGLQENKTGTRQGENREKIGRRQGEDKDKTGTRQGQNRDKTGTRKRQ